MTEFKSRLSAEYPEYAEWRYKQALANSRIEGIEPNPENEKFFNDRRAKGIPEKEIREEFIRKIMEENKTKAKS